MRPTGSNAIRAIGVSGLSTTRASRRAAATILLSLGLVARLGQAQIPWTPPSPLNGNANNGSGDDWFPEVTTDGKGTWIAVWASDDFLQETIGPDYDIFFARSVDNGLNWTFPAPLNRNAASDSGYDYSPQLTTDGGSTWIVVWESEDSLGGTIGPDSDVLYARSEDYGLTWSPPAPLNATATADAEGDERPQLTTDGAGIWLAIWQSWNSLGGTIGSDWDILYARSIDNGLTWSPPAALNSNATSGIGWDGDPQLTTDGTGTWVALWESDESLGGTIGTDGDILYARSTDNGLNWTPAAPLNTNAETDTGGDWTPQLTANGAGTWIAVWESEDSLSGTIGTDYDILYARSTDNGLNWTPPTHLNTNAGSDTRGDWTPQLTTDGNGTWIAVWFSADSLSLTGGVDSDVLYARSGDLGLTWTTPALLSANATGGGGADWYAQLTTDASGTWMAVWQSRDSLGATIGGDIDILYARSVDDGLNWTGPAPFNANASSDGSTNGDPQLTTDGTGTWIAVWESADSLGDSIGLDGDILYARTTDNGLNWTPPAPLNTNADSDTGGDWTPQLTTNGTGTWIAVWESENSLGGTIGTDYDILYTRSTDNGLTWTPPAPLNANAPTDTGFDGAPELTTDMAGTWIAVWWSDESFQGTIGTDWDILYARSVDKGLTWTAPAPLNANAISDTGVDWNAQLTTDGAGTWIVVWQSDDSLQGTVGSDWDILFARSGDDGMTWTAPAQLNANAATDSGHDEQPQLTTDRAGSWVAVWHSADSLNATIGTDYDILYARSVNNGLTWTTPAPLNANAASDVGGDSQPQLTRDDGGNWIAVWQSWDSLGGAIGADWDIFFVKADFTGNIAGFVVDASTGIGLTCAAVRVRSQDGTLERVATTDLNGEYRFLNVPAGNYTLQAFSPGFEPQLLVAAVIAGSDTPLTFNLVVGAGESDIVGLVTDENTMLPLGGVGVTAEIGGTIVATTYTCAEGRYAFSGLAAKATLVNLKFSAFGYVDKTAEVELVPGEIFQFDVQLKPKAELSGSLVGNVKDAETGEPLPEVRVTVTKAGIGQTLYTDSLGRYYFGLLDPGHYEIHVAMAGFADQRRTIAVLLGTVTEAEDFSLESITPQLWVYPTVFIVPATAGSDQIAVENIGHGTLIWDAAVTAGSVWLSVATAKVVGNGALIVTWSENTSSDPRAGAIEVSAAGAIDSPVLVQVTQTGAIIPPTPILEISPQDLIFDRAGGTHEVRITNAGEGTLMWTAMDSPDEDWLALSFGKVTGNGTIVAICTPNAGIPRRNAAIRVDAEAASGSPAIVQVLQLGAPEDTDRNDVVNAVDVQLVINEALSIETGYDCDVDDDNDIDAVDVQRVINVALGLT
ncbi:MAG: carboxypeptidase regulatory-like domain-containing protein [Candidatus Hydrogenedentes bacterium]|nr:carboxypeptidase regulatory-like domain-containing protein [Candidatus Hydrogenedentota bacterium]